MKYLDYKEPITHGTFDFPIAYYYVDAHHPRYEMQLHWHPEYELIHVRQGVLHMDMDGRRFDVRAGDTVFVTDGVCHSAVPEECVYECLVFDLGQFVSVNRIGSQPLQNILKHKCFVRHTLPAEADGLAVIIEQLLDAMREQPLGYELFVRGGLYQLLGVVVRDHLYGTADVVARRNRHQQSSLKNAIQYMEDNYAQHITLDELAHAAGMNRKYFCTFFHSMTLKTPFEYLNSYRVSMAGEWLLGSDRSIADIAVDCGFNDVSYFSKMFRRYVGETPRNYRKNYRTGGED